MPPDYRKVFAPEDEVRCYLRAFPQSLGDFSQAIQDA